MREYFVSLNQKGNVVIIKKETLKNAIDFAIENCKTEEFDNVSVRIDNRDAYGTVIERSEKCVTADWDVNYCEESDITYVMCRILLGGEFYSTECTGWHMGFPGDYSIREATNDRVELYEPDNKLWEV